MWAIRIVNKPVSRLIERKNESDAAPTTIAGAAMSAKTIELMSPLPQKRYRPSAIDKGVPTMTDTTAEMTATSSEVTNAWLSPSTCVRLRYQ